MASTRKSAYPVAREVPGIQSGGSVRVSACIPLVAGSANASDVQVSGLLGALAPFSGYATEKPREPRSVHAAQRPCISVSSSKGAHRFEEDLERGAHRRRPVTSALASSPNGRLPNVLPLLSHKRLSERGELLALMFADIIRLPPHGGNVASKWAQAASGGSNAMRGFCGGNNQLDSSRAALHKMSVMVAASGNSAASEEGGSINGCRRQRFADENIAYFTQRRDNGCSGIGEAQLTNDSSDLYTQRSSGTPCASACTVKAPVDSSPVFVGTSSIATAPGCAFCPDGCNGSGTFGSHGEIPALNGHYQVYDEWTFGNQTGTCEPYKEETMFVATPSSASHSAYVKHLPPAPSEDADQPSFNGGSTELSRGRSPLVSLVQGIIERTATVLPINVLAQILAATLHSAAPLCDCAGDLQTPVTQANLSGKLLCALVELERLSRDVLRKKVATEGRKPGGKSALRIQKLPTGKRLEDYYAVGPILDVCVQQQQQHSKTSSRRRRLQKRRHSPQLTAVGCEVNTNFPQAECRYGDSQGDEQKSIALFPITNVGGQVTRNQSSQSMGAGGKACMQVAAKITKGEAEFEERFPPTAAKRRRKTSRSRMEAAQQQRASPCMEGEIIDERAKQRASVSVKAQPLKKDLQARVNTAFTSGRPILRFAVQRLRFDGLQKIPNKIIKTIDKRRIPASAGGDKLWRRLCGRLLNLPAHPNVLTMEAVFEDQASFHFVFERLEGGELFEFLMKEKMVEEHVCQYIIYQILTALHHLHSHNLLHRDIKPENLVFRRRRCQKQIAAERSTKCSTGAWTSSPNSLANSSSTLDLCHLSNGACVDLFNKCSSSNAGDRSLTTTWSSSARSSSSSSTSCIYGVPVDRDAPRRCYATLATNSHPHLPRPAESREDNAIYEACSSFESSSMHCNNRQSTKCGARSTSFAPPGGNHKQKTPENQSGEGCFAYNNLRQTEYDYELVLIDFDTCKMLEVTADEYGEIVAGRRRLVGTYGYLAPEVLSGHAYSVQSDLWSVGIILYILMTGNPPLPMDAMVSACSSLNVFLQLCEEHGGIAFDVAPLPDFPLAQDLCRRLLRLHPKDRTASAHSALSHPWLDISSGELSSIISSATRPIEFDRWNRFHAQRTEKNMVSVHLSGPSSPRAQASSFGAEQRTSSLSLYSSPCIASCVPPASMRGSPQRAAFGWEHAVATAPRLVPPAFSSSISPLDVLPLYLPAVLPAHKTQTDPSSEESSVAKKAVQSCWALSPVEVLRPRDKREGHLLRHVSPK